MKKIVVSTLLLVLVSVALAFSDRGTPTAAGSETGACIIKEGDTVWTTSGDAFQYRDPNGRPLVGNDDAHITSPTMIRPTDSPALGVTKPVVGESGPTVCVIPGEVVTHPDRVAARTIPSSGTEETSVTESSDVYYVPKVLNAGFLTKEELEDSGYIDHTRENPKYLSEDTTVFIRLPRERLVELKRGDRFSVFRVVEEVKHPVTHDKVGYAVDIVGELEVTSIGAETAAAVITNATDVIRLNDRIRPFEPAVKTIRLKKGKNPVVGYVVYASSMKRTHNEEPLIAENDIVFIDRGYGDGVEIGNIFDILRLQEEYNRGELTAEQYQEMLESNTVSEKLSSKGIIYPPDVVGRIVILNVGEYTSTGVISRSNYPVKIGDLVRLQVE